MAEVLESRLTPGYWGLKWNFYVKPFLEISHFYTQTITSGNTYSKSKTTSKSEAVLRIQSPFNGLLMRRNSISLSLGRCWSKIRVLSRSS